MARAVSDLAELAEQLDDGLIEPAELRYSAAIVCEPILPSATDRALAEIWERLRDDGLGQRRSETPRRAKSGTPLASG